MDRTRSGRTTPVRLAAFVAMVFVVSAAGALSPAAVGKGLPDSGTIEFASDSGWLTFAANPGRTVSVRKALGYAQQVCMNGSAPAPCPAGATIFGSPFSGWTADLTPIPGASWIWGPGVDGSTSGAELATYWFAKRIVVPENPSSGIVYLSADDYAEVWVNGVLAGTVGSVVDAGLAGAHAFLTPFDVTALLKEGRNVIAVHAQNGPTWYSPFCDITCTYSQNPAGTVFGARVSWSDD